MERAPETTANVVRGNPSLCTLHKKISLGLGDTRNASPRAANEEFTTVVGNEIGCRLHSEAAFNKGIVSCFDRETPVERAHRAFCSH